jgi:hypothetical protein
MPSYQDYVSEAEKAKKALPPEWQKYGDTYDEAALQKYASYADEAKKIIDDPAAAITIAEDYIVKYVGDALGLAVATAAGAAIGTCIPVPFLGTAIGAAVGLGVAYLRGLMKETPFVDGYLGNDGNVMPQVEMALDEWIDPVTVRNKFGDVGKFHAWFHTRDGQAMQMPGQIIGAERIDRYIKTGLRAAPEPYTADGKDYPAGSENWLEMGARFYIALQKARTEFIQDKVHEAQAHAQITDMAVRNAFAKGTAQAATLSHVNRAVAAVGMQGVHPAIAAGVVGLVAMATAGSSAAKTSIAVVVDAARSGDPTAIANARALTSAQRVAVMNSFVDYYSDLRARRAA